MAHTGPQLAAAGFDVRVPALSRAQGHAVAARVRRRRVGVGRSARTSSPNVRWSAVFDDVELTAADIARAGQGSAAAHPLRWAVGRDRPGRPARRGRARSPSAPTRPSCPAPTMLRLALGHRRLAARAVASPSSVAAGRPICSRRRPTCRVANRPAPPTVSSASCAATRPRRWRGSASSTQAGLGGCLALDMGLGKTPTMLAHLLAGAGAGPALVIAPPAVVGNWAAEAARFTPGLRVVVHHGADRAARRRDRGRGRRRRRRRHHLRHRGARRRRASPTVDVGDASSSTRRRRSRTPPTTRRSSCAGSRRGRGSRSPARRSRTVSATCGRSSTSPIPASSARGRSSSPRLVERRRDARARRSRGRDARAQRHPRVPPHEGRARDRGRAARPDRRARPLRDDPRADRPVPGAARHAGDRHDAARGREAAQGPDPRRDHRAQADLQPSGRVPGRRPAARRSLGQARAPRGDRRRGVRGRRDACWCSRTSPSGASSSPSTSPSAPARRSTCYHGGLSRTVRDQHDRRLPGAARARARSCCR